MNYLKLTKAAKLFLIFILTLSITTLSSRSHADELGEHILSAILSGEKASDSALLLLTRDLKWYEANMGRLPVSVQNKVQQIRINIAGDSSRMAANALDEAEAVFSATGSWKPGRDMDILYLGAQGDEAAEAISASYEATTGKILAQAGNDPILQQFGGNIPKNLTADSLAVCTTELPNYGYGDLQKAYKKARDALARGESKEEVLEMFRQEIKQAMGKNVKAHFAAASNPDYYAGATGQEWFRKAYLENPEKMRMFVQDANGNWVLREAGVAALPDEIVQRLGFGGFKSGHGKFAKIASDYSLFFSHMGGGPSDNAKYVMRVWQDIGLNAIQDLTDAELKLLAASKAISNNPSRASQILAEMGIESVEEFNESLSKILFRWTESQLVKDMNRLVAELGASGAKSLDELEALLRQAKVKFDLQELIAGLDKLKTAPKKVRLAFMEILKKRFGSTESGKAVINFIMRQLQLLGEESGELTKRIIKMLQGMGRISDDEAKAALKNLDAGLELDDAVAAKVQRTRKEVSVLAAGSMTDFDEALDLNDLMEDWRRSQPDAILQSPSRDLRNMIDDLRNAPDTRLKGMGWTAEELRIQNKIKSMLHKESGMIKRLGEKLGKKLAKVQISLRRFQKKLRSIMFNKAYVQLAMAFV